VAIHFQKTIENSKKIEGKFPLTPSEFSNYPKKTEREKKTDPKESLFNELLGQLLLKCDLYSIIINKTPVRMNILFWNRRLENNE
jgi:hypothetical protein